MRARRNIGIAQLLSKTHVEEKTIQQESLDMHVAVDGPTAAAWLVRRHKRALHHAGAVDLKIDGHLDSPSWFRIAIEMLKRRPAKWLVITQTMRGTRTYRVRWLGWRQNTREARELGWSIDG